MIRPVRRISILSCIQLAEVSPATNFDSTRAGDVGGWKIYCVCCERQYSSHQAWSWRLGGSITVAVQSAIQVSRVDQLLELMGPALGGDNIFQITKSGSSSQCSLCESGTMAFLLYPTSVCEAF